MRRAIAKAALQAVVGHLPGGARLYHRATREWWGTQATHVDKLARVLPGYTAVWRAHGLALEGARIWIHEPGYTPFWPLSCYRLTGGGGVHTNVHARMLHRYLARAANQASTVELPGGDGERADRVGAQRWAASVDEALDAVGALLQEAVDPAAVPLADRSVDLCHSGGTLEHVRPDVLLAYLRECARVVRPGGLVSHVIDHRDHLRHADPSWPFLAHLRWSNAAYGAAFGHPLGYHNRGTPAQVRRLFDAAGLEVLTVRRLLLPSHRWVDTEAETLAGEAGIDRASLAPRFGDLSEADRRTAAAHYLARPRTHS